LTTGNVVFEPGVWLAVEFDWENADTILMQKYGTQY
jgi:hypothetical protein